MFLSGFLPGEKGRPGGGCQERRSGRWKEERQPVAEAGSPVRGGRQEDARKGEALSARTDPALSRRPHRYGFIAGNYTIYNIEAVVLINNRSILD